MKSNLLLSLRPFSVLLCCVWAAAVNHAAPVKFDLPALPAAAGLVQFARQAGLEVLFAHEEVRNFRTNAVTGLHEPEAALELLLRDTGLASTRVAAGKFIVKAAPHGRVSGRVLAAPGGGLAGARIGLPNRTVVTRSARDGSFRLPVVPVGRHDFLVVAEGRRPVQVAGVLVEEGRETVLPPVTPPEGDATGILDPLVVESAAEPAGAGSTGTPVQLDRLVVTPSRFGYGDDTAVSAATLTAGDLAAMPQLGEDLFRAISRLPGLASGDFSAKFWVRGAPNDQVLTRLDGVDLLEPFHMKDVDGALSTIDLETVARLDLFTGGFTAEYGGRMAGVLTMETDTFTRPGRRTTLGLSLTGARVTSRGAFDGGRASWLLSARSGYPDITIEKAKEENSEIKPRYHDVFGKVEFQPGPNHRLAVHVLWADDRMEVRESGDPDLASNYDSADCWVRWRGSWNERLRGEAVLSHARLGWHRRGMATPEDPLRLDLRDDRELTTTGLRQDWSLLVSDRLLLRSGLEYSHRRADYDYHREQDEWVVRNGRMVRTRPRVAAQFAPTGDAAGAYGAVRFQPRETITLEAGARFDRQDATGRDSRMFGPRLNAAWAVGRTTVRAAWGVYHQPQELHQIAVAHGETRVAVPEHAEHRVIGLERRLASDVNLRVELYERLTFDPRARWENVSEVDVFPEANWDRVLLRPTRARATGVELFAERRGSHPVRWTASYAWAEATETIAGRKVPRSRDQRHTFSGAVSYQPNARWCLSAAWQFHSGWPFTQGVYSSAPVSGGTVLQRDLSAPYDGRLPSYHRLDLRATRFIPLRSGTLRLFVDIFNAYDRANVYRYDEHVGFDNGRMVVSRETEKLFPLLPSVGAVWEF